MGEIGRIVTKSFLIPGTKIVLVINPQTLLMTWIVIAILVVVAVILSRRLKKFPGRRQCCSELIATAFDNLLRETLGDEGRKFLPLVATLFLFVLLSNWLGIIPGLRSPTSDLNTTLGLGIFVFLVAHISAMRKKGLWNYIKGYFQPFILLFPLNVVSEFGKVISHSFRLFGNMFGGAIMLSVTGPIVMEIFRSMGLPHLVASPIIVAAFIWTQFFFGFFVGTVQALVFAMLALTYIQVARG